MREFTSPVVIHIGVCFPRTEAIRRQTIQKLCSGSFLSSIPTIPVFIYIINIR